MKGAFNAVTAAAQAAWPDAWSSSSRSRWASSGGSSAWSFGIKAFDAFLLTAIVTVVAAAAHMAKPFLDQMRGRGTPAAERPDF